MSFADRLNAIMKQRKKSGYKLAKETGLAESGIRRLRAGASQPREKTIELLAEALDCDPAWLRYGKEERLFPDVMQLARKLHKYKKLNPESFEKVKAAIEALIK